MSWPENVGENIHLQASLGHLFKDVTLPFEMSGILSHCGPFSKEASIFLDFWFQQNQIAQSILHQKLYSICIIIFDKCH